MTFERDAFVAAAAFVASAINAGAGGGSFLSFPALLAAGIAPIPANATNNTAMWVGGLASIGELRSELTVPRATLVKMLAVSVCASVLGALVLLHTSNAAFATLIPWLLLAATALFIAGPRLTAFAAHARSSLRPDSPAGLAAQGAIGFYGGFFGAAIGILMLALLGVLGMHDLRRANAFKVLLATAINGVAVVPFALAGAIAWEPAGAMSVGALAGGWAGARVVKALPDAVVRAGVSAVALAMTGYFFWKTYWR